MIYTSSKRIWFLLLAFGLSITGFTFAQEKTTFPNYTVQQAPKGDLTVTGNLIVQWTITSPWFMSKWQGVQANGQYSTAMWYQTQANWTYSTTIWAFTKTYKNYSTAIWYMSTVSGDYSTAIWSSVKANWYGSTAIGTYTQANWDYSTAIWANLTASWESSMVIGKNNLPDSNKLFIIWNWSYSSRSNALTLDYSWNLRIAWTLTQSSDKNLKKNIKILDNAKNILKLNWYSYNLKSDNSKQMWVIAQEVQKVFPELVSKDLQWNLSVNYVWLIAPMLEVIKNQEERIQKLETLCGK